MPLLPGDPLAVAGLAFIVLATVWVVRTEANKAYAIGVVILLVFMAQSVDALFFARDRFVAWLSLRPGPFLAGNQWWAPLTYMYVHAPLPRGGFLHVFGNLFLLLTAGPILADRIGPRRFLVIYFAAGLFAAASAVALSLAGIVNPVTANVGASGAIFGVLTAFAMLYPRETIPIPLGIIIWVPSFLVLLAYLAVNVGLVFVSSNIAWYGHFAGFLVGLAASVPLERKEGPQRSGAVDVSALRPLATTERLEGILHRLEGIEGSTPDDALWTSTWLERFAASATCPECGSDLVLEGQHLRCETGDWELEVPERPKEDAL